MTIGRFLLGWLLVALALGASGALSASVPPPVIAFGLTTLILLVIATMPRAREAVRGLGLRTLIAFHSIRIVAGAYFLLLYRNGQLPAEFALPAGWGDIAVGVLAIGVALFAVPVTSSLRLVTILVWNVAGLIDILGVLGNGVRLFLADPSLGAAFARLPLALLPLFVVPLVIATHILIFVWAPRGRE